MSDKSEIVVREQAGFLAPAVSVDDALRAYQAKKDLIDGIMRSGVDYGPIPGSDKPTLKKAGAEKATSFFGLSPRFKDDEVVEDWTGVEHGGEPFFYYRRTCELWRGEHLVASVGGSCNSWEKKYRSANAPRKPQEPRKVAEPIKRAQLAPEAPVVEEISAGYVPVDEFSQTAAYQWSAGSSVPLPKGMAERVQDISNEEARAEGCDLCKSIISDIYSDESESFAILWDSIYSKSFPWEGNPWVWIVEFKRIAQ